MHKNQITINYRMENHIMNKKAVIYFGVTGDKETDSRTMCILEQYCKKKGYEVIAVLSENITPDGMSFPMKYAFIGMKYEEDVETVVTLVQDMIAPDIEEVFNAVMMLGEYGIEIDTADGKMDHFDEEWEEYQDKIDEDIINSKIKSDEKSFMSFMSELFQNIRGM